MPLQLLFQEPQCPLLAPVGISHTCGADIRASKTSIYETSKQINMQMIWKTWNFPGISCIFKQHSSRLPAFSLFVISLCVLCAVLAPTHEHAEVTSGHWMSSSMAVLVTLGVSYWILSSPFWPTSEFRNPVVPTTGVTSHMAVGTCSHVWLSSWMLETRIQVLMFAEQVWLLGPPLSHVLTSFSGGWL